MEITEIKKEFVKFLKERNLYAEYVREFEHYIKTHHIDTTTLDSLIGWLVKSHSVGGLVCFSFVYAETKLKEKWVDVEWAWQMYYLDLLEKEKNENSELKSSVL